MQGVANMNGGLSYMRKDGEPAGAGGLPTDVSFQLTDDKTGDSQPGRITYAHTNA